jgi:hypothetical protein
MKRLCAWCGGGLGTASRRDDQPPTHGLCPACRRRFFPAAGRREVAPAEQSRGEAPGGPPAGLGPEAPVPGKPS